MPLRIIIFIVIIFTVPIFIVFKFNKREIYIGATVFWALGVLEEVINILCFNAHWSPMDSNWLLFGIFGGVAYCGIIYLLKILFRLIQRLFQKYFKYSKN